jgi:hypothetical protein
VTAYSGTCGNFGPEIACNDDTHGEPSRISVDVAAGQTILIEVTRFDNGGSGQLLFRLSASNVANDDCANAATISDFPFTSAISTRDATTEPEDPAQSCGPRAPAQNHNSVWYQYTAPGGSTRLIATTYGSGYETTLTAYNGSCGSLQETACDSNSTHSEIEVTVQSGQTVYFEVTQSLRFEPPGGGPLLLNVSSVPPENDQCAQATEIPPSSDFLQTVHTRGATTDAGDPFQTCVGPAATNAKSVWYRYTAGAEGVFTASTAGSSYDTVLSALVGNCQGLEEILQMVGIAISDLPLSQCEIGDEDSDGEISVHEIIPAVYDALSGCR